MQISKASMIGLFILIVFPGLDRLAFAMEFPTRHVPEALTLLEKFYHTSTHSAVSFSDQPYLPRYSAVYSLALNGRILAVLGMLEGNPVVEFWRLQGERRRQRTSIIRQAALSVSGPISRDSRIFWAGDRLLFSRSDQPFVSASFGGDRLFISRQRPADLILYSLSEPAPITFPHLFSHGLPLSAALDATWAVVASDEGQVVAVHRPTRRITTFTASALGRGGDPNYGYPIDSLLLEGQSGLITVSRRGLARVWNLEAWGSEIRATSLDHRVAQLFSDPTSHGFQPSSYLRVHFSRTPEGQFVGLAQQAYGGSMIAHVPDDLPESLIPDAIVSEESGSPASFSGSDFDTESDSEGQDPIVSFGTTTGAVEIFNIHSLDTLIEEERRQEEQKRREQLATHVTSIVPQIVSDDTYTSDSELGGRSSDSVGSSTSWIHVPQEEDHKRNASRNILLAPSQHSSENRTFSPAHSQHSDDSGFSDYVRINEEEKSGSELSDFELVSFDETTR